MPADDLDRKIANANPDDGWTLESCEADGWTMLLSGNGGPLDEDDMPAFWVQHVDEVNRTGDVVVGWPLFCGRYADGAYELFDADTFMDEVAAIKREGLSLATRVYARLTGEEVPCPPKTQLFCSIGESPEIALGDEEEGGSDDQ